MTFSISSFRSAIGTGVRPNLFRVTVASGLSIGKDLASSLLVKSAAIPGSTIGVIEIPHIGGRRLKVAGDRTYADWTMTVINDGNYDVRKVYEDYHKSFVSTNYTTTTVGTRSTALATVKVIQLNADGTAIRNYQLQNCFITNISSIDLSYDSSDAIEEFTVTWSYDYFTAANSADET